MTGPGLALFDTAIGRCGIAWSERGVVRVQLPEADEAHTWARLARLCPGTPPAEPPPEVRHAVMAITAHLRGEPSDLSVITLDMGAVPPFSRLVYETARAIPPGSTLSYGAVAARLGRSNAARAVGQALRRNPFAIVVPCHRVLAATGKPDGFSAHGGVTTKLMLLRIEGLPCPSGQAADTRGRKAPPLRPRGPLDTLDANRPLAGVAMGISETAAKLPVAARWPGHGAPRGP
ncbi:MAG TPA: methylated-DNA--[protein]-cysteine S-methyltransferase [Streptosporangiaceae bacterium]|nr:methylated-DNA--[protein]-cysteine S-methyltransferase [Streptosporangiaceae bacterium]